MKKPLATLKRWLHIESDADKLVRFLISEVGRTERAMDHQIKIIFDRDLFIRQKPIDPEIKAVLNDVLNEMDREA